MAITKLLRIKENAYSSNKSAGLKRCIDYICNPEKTEDGKLVIGNAGNNPAFIYAEMASNKYSWDKEDGSQGYHYVISFPPDELVSPEMALRVAEEFCTELLGNQYIYVIACHTDTDHLHCHIVFDSVNCSNGFKYHSGKYDWLARIQPITDSICQKYGLSTLSFDMDKERSSMYHKEWEDSKEKDKIKKEVSWADIIRDDIDECISSSDSWDGFLSAVEDKHYEIRDGKYLSLKPYGKDKAVRSIRLGPGYSKEALQSRIGKKPPSPEMEGMDYKTYGDAVPLCRAAVNHLPASRMQEQFYSKCMKLSHIRNPHFHSAWRYKKDAVQLGRLADLSAYLFENDMTSIQDVASRLEELEKTRGRDASEERRLCKSIAQEYQKMNQADDILHGVDAVDTVLPSKSDVFQIYANQKLLENPDFSQETFRVRLPGKEEYIRLYSADSRMYNNGGMVSSFLHGPAIYQIEAADGTVLRHASGGCAKEYFKSRAINLDGYKTR